MAVKDQDVGEHHALYNGDCCEVLQSIADRSVDMVLYSPPFATESGGALYNYSSSDRDFSNARTYDDFFQQYDILLGHLARVIKPGRIAAVHCMDVPKQGANICGYTDFPGDIIRLHQKHGFEYLPRICIWKEPLEVRNRTMSKALAHRQIVDDSTQTNVAAADYLIPFRRRGENKEPVIHPTGLQRYAGSRSMPKELHRFRGWTGKQTENRYSHWIWRNYASCFWDDIRLDRVLDLKSAMDDGDERHQHPLQLDVIERACVLWTNEGDIVLSPFAGVGSELCGAISLGRNAVGIELKESYYRQAIKNIRATGWKCNDEKEQHQLFDQDTRKYCEQGGLASPGAVVVE